MTPTAVPVAPRWPRKAPATPRAPSYVISAKRLTTPMTTTKRRASFRVELRSMSREESFVHVKGLTLAKFEYDSAKMQPLDECFFYSASDLNDYLECKRLTELETLVARKKLIRPNSQDERANLIRRKGE